MLLAIASAPFTLAAAAIIAALMELASDPVRKGRQMHVK